MKNTTGKIKFFNEEKGYGFIVPDGDGKDVFFHISSLKMNDVSPTHNSLKDKEVRYELKDGKKGPEAIDVRSISEN